MDLEQLKQNFKPLSNEQMPESLRTKVMQAIDEEAEQMVAEHRGTIKNRQVHKRIMFRGGIGGSIVAILVLGVILWNHPSIQSALNIVQSNALAGGDTMQTNPVESNSAIGLPNGDVQSAQSLSHTSQSNGTTSSVSNAKVESQHLPQQKGEKSIDLNKKQTDVTRSKQMNVEENRVFSSINSMQNQTSETNSNSIHPSSSNTADSNTSISNSTTESGPAANASAVSSGTSGNDTSAQNSNTTEAAPSNTIEQNSVMFTTSQSNSTSVQWHHQTYVLTSQSVHKIGKKIGEYQQENLYMISGVNTQTAIAVETSVHTFMRANIKN